MGSLGLRLARPPFLAFDFSSGLSWPGLARRPTSLQVHSCSLWSVASVSRRWARSRLASETPRSPAPGALLVWHPAGCVDSIYASISDFFLSSFQSLARCCCVHLEFG